LDDVRQKNELSLIGGELREEVPDWIASDGKILKLSLIGG
jgi:hypothetical protein